MRLIFSRATVLAFLCCANSVWAGAADALSNFVGYTIIATKTIDSFIDKGKAKKDGFEGCDHDRVIVFTDGTSVTCRTYSYTYSYRPTAVILGKQVTFQGRQVTLLKLIVEDSIYDIGGN